MKSEDVVLSTSGEAGPMIHKKAYPSLPETEAAESRTPTRCPGRKDEIHNNTMNQLGYFLYKDTGEPCCYLCYVNAKLDHLRPWYNDNFHSPHTAMCVMEASQLDSAKKGV